MKRPAAYPSRGCLAGASRIVAPLAAILLSSGLAGCFTMLRHPMSGSEAPGGDSQECEACHAAEVGGGVHLLPWVGHYTASTAPWINYYASPWWQDWRWEQIDGSTGPLIAPPSGPGPALPPSGGVASAGQDGPTVNNRRATWGQVPRHLVRKAGEEIRQRDPSIAPPPVPGPPPALQPVTPPAVSAPAEPTDPQAPPADQNAQDPKNQRQDLPKTNRTLRR